MDIKEALAKDNERESTGFYDAGIGKLLCDKWVGSFNKLNVSMQQQILDYAEAVAVEHYKQMNKKVLPVSADAL